MRACRAGARAVDLGGPSVYQGGQSVKLRVLRPCLLIPLSSSFTLASMLQR